MFTIRSALELDYTVPGGTPGLIYSLVLEEVLLSLIPVSLGKQK